MAYENWTVRVRFADWVDVTADVETVTSPIKVTSGETAETSDASGSLVLVLRNPTQEYTPGNTLSTHYPYVRSGREVELTETIGGTVFQHFTGWLEWPEIESWARSDEAAPREQTITLTAVDLRGRADGAATFVSNIGAHVLAVPSQVKAYWSMGGAGPVAYNDAPVRQPSLRADPFHPGDATAKQAEAFLWSDATAPGDDIAVPTWVSSGTSDLVDLELAADFATPVTATAGQVVTVAAWLKVGLISASALSLTSTIAFVAEDGGSLSQIVLQVTRDAAGALFLTPVFSISDGTHTLSLDWAGESVPMPIDAWRLVSLQVALSTATDAQRLCVGTSTYTATAAGTVPTAIQLDRISRIGQHVSGSIGHLQIHVTDTVDLYDQAGQVSMGMYGLEQQTTGQRIRTIGHYLGLTDAELVGVDAGVSVMARAALAGITPGAAWAEAEETEQGSLYIGGDGLPIFDDRRTLYNV